MDDAYFVIPAVINLALLAMFIATVANVSRLRRMVESLMFPEGPPSILRICAHCRRQMPELAAVCAFCTRESERWEVREGRWWKRDEAGRQVVLDLGTMTWVDPSPSSG